MISLKKERLDFSNLLDFKLKLLKIVKVSRTCVSQDHVAFV